MATNRDIAERIEERVRAFMHQIKERHTLRVDEATASGSSLGSVNTPDVEQSEQPSPEQRIRGQYEQDLSEAASRFTPGLESARVALDEAAKALRKPDDTWRKDTDEQIAQETKKRDEQLRLTTERRDREVSAIEEFINDQIQAPFNELKARRGVVQRATGRQRPEIWFKSHAWYLVLLIAIGACEYPLNALTFQVLGTNYWDTLLMASSLVLSVPILAHFTGIALKRRNVPGQQTSNIAIAVIAAVLMVALSYFTAIARADWAREVAGLTVSTPLFMVLSVLLYGVGTLLSFGHHDDSADLENVDDQFVHAESRYQVEKREAEERRSALFAAHEGRVDGIHNDYASSVEGIRNQRRTIAHVYRDNLAVHNATLAGLKAIEQTSRAQCSEAIEAFRTANILSRRNQQKPVFATADSHVLPRYFDHYDAVDLVRHSSAA